MFRLTSAFHIARFTVARKAARTKVIKAPMVALAQSHPLLVAGWMGAASSKFETPDTLNPSSAKLGWWRCSGCDAQFRRKIADHVLLAGKCPHCSMLPTGSSGPVMRGATATSLTPTPHVVARPIRTSATTINAVNPKAIRKHITDIPYFAGFNGLRRKMLQPMLAHTFEDRAHKIKFDGKEDIFVSPKIDGIRCLVACDPTDGNRVYYFSRQGLLFDSCDHLDAHFARLFAVDPTAIIDGELFYNGVVPNKGTRMTFEDLMSVVRTSKPNRTDLIEANQQLVQYHAFDVPFSASLGDLKGFGERLRYLSGLMQACHVGDACDASRRLMRTVPNRRIVSMAAALSVRDAFIAEGFEGAMLRRGGEPYAHGKRSAALLKMKCMTDSEYKIIGAIEGQGKMANSLGAFVCETVNGSTFTVSPSVDEVRRKALWENVQTLIGSALTVQYQELSAQGIPRFPVGKAIRGPSMSSRTWL